METDVNCDCWGFVLFYRNIFPLYPINLSFVKRVIFHHGSHHDVPGPHVPSYVSYFCVSFFRTGAVKIIFWTHFLMSSSLKLHSFSAGHGLLCFQSLVSRFICLGWAEEFRDISWALDAERQRGCSKKRTKLMRMKNPLWGEHTSSLGSGFCCRLILYLVSLCPWAGKTAYSPSFYSLLEDQLGFWYELHQE